MPASLSEWRVRIGTFVHWIREYEVKERRERLLKERIRRLKVLCERLEAKRGDSGEGSQNDKSRQNGPNPKGCSHQIANIQSSGNSSDIKDLLTSCDQCIQELLTASDSHVKEILTPSDKCIKQLLTPTDSNIRHLLSLTNCCRKDKHTACDSHVEGLTMLTPNYSNIRELIIHSDSCFRELHTCMSADAFKDDMLSDSDVKDLLTPRDSAISEILQPKEYCINRLLTPRDSYIQKSLTPRDSCIQELLTPRDSCIQELLTPRDSYIQDLLSVNSHIQEMFTPRDSYTSESLTTGDSYNNVLLKIRDSYIQELLTPRDSYTCESLAPRDSCIKELLTPRDSYIKELLSVNSHTEESLSTGEGYIPELLTPRDSYIQELLTQRDSYTSGILSPKDSYFLQLFTSGDSHIVESFTPIDSNTNESLTPIDSNTNVSLTPIDSNTNVSLTPGDCYPYESLTQEDSYNQDFLTPRDSYIQDLLTPRDSYTVEPLTLGDSYIQELFTPRDSHTNELLMPTDSYANEPLTPGDSYIQELLTPRDSYTNESLTPGHSFTNMPLTQGDSYPNKLLTPTDSYAYEPLTPGDSYIQELLTAGDSFTNESLNRGDSFIQDFLTPRESYSRELFIPRDSHTNELLTPTDFYANEPYTPGDSYIQELLTPRDSHTNELLTPTYPYINEPFTPGDAYIEEILTPRDSYTNESLTLGHSFINKPLTQGDSYANKLPTPTDSYANEPLTPGDSYIQELLTPRDSHTNELLTPRDFNTNESLTPGDSYIQELLTPRDSYTNESLTPGHSFTNTSLTPGDSYIHELLTTGDSSTNEPLIRGDCYIQDFLTLRECYIRELLTPRDFNTNDSLTPGDSYIQELLTPIDSYTNEPLTPGHSYTNKSLTGVELESPRQGDKNSSPTSSLESDAVQHGPFDGKEMANTSSRSSCHKTDSLKGKVDVMLSQQPSLTELLLVKSGDVELNPGPLHGSIDSVLQESELILLAKEVPDDCYIKLCIGLGFSLSQSQNVLTRHHWNFTGALIEFFGRWKVNQRDGTNCRALLGEILQITDMVALQTKLLEGEYLTSGTPTSSIDSVLQESELILLAKEVHTDCYYKLCIGLGFSLFQSQIVLNKHRWDFTGAMIEFFCRWRVKQRDGTNCRALLGEILQITDMVALQTKLLEGEYLTSGTSPSDPILMTEAQVLQCGEDLKTFYSEEMCKIQPNPLDFNIVVEFEQIYTNLTLLRKEMGTRRAKTPLDYTDLLTTKINGVLPKRLLVEGEGLVGKTTFCSKIAWDWVNGSPELQHFSWVLVIPLRNVVKGQTIGDIMKNYLSDNNAVNPKQIEHYILSQPTKVLIVLDGLDQYDGDLSAKETSDISRILRLETFKQCIVLVTTRPWRADKIKSNKELSRSYAFIEIQGFSDENVSTYISKYFVNDEKAGSELIRLIDENDVINNMAPFPIYIAMLCILWENSGSEKQETISRLKTLSQLTEQMIKFLRDHYVSKVDKEMENTNLCLQRIGSIAFSGILKKKLIFNEEDFSLCKEAMETCCRMGVLSRGIQNLSGWRRTLTASQPITSFFFPHRLFQEYIASVYIASLYDTNRERYSRLMGEVLSKNPEEFRYLLYFIAALGKEMGLDIVEKIQQNEIPNVQQRRRNNDFLADVAFEAYDKDMAKAVGQQIFADKRILTIDKDMPAHTVSGYLFIMEQHGMETLVLRGRSCGPSVSRDLANVLHKSNSLSRLVFYHTRLDDDFYQLMDTRVSTMGGGKSSIKELVVDHQFLHGLQRFDNGDINVTIEDLFPSLKQLTFTTLHTVSPGDVQRLAHSSLAVLFIEHGEEGSKLVPLIGEPASLGQLFSSSFPQLTCLTFRDLVMGNIRSEAILRNLKNHLHLKSISIISCFTDDELDLLAEQITTENRMKITLQHDRAQRTLSFGSSIGPLTMDMIDALCHRTCARQLVGFNNAVKITGEECFPDFHGREVDSKIQTFKFYNLKLLDDQSASYCLGKFLSLLPHLKDLEICLCSFHDDFYKDVADRAFSSQLQTFKVFDLNLHDDLSASHCLGKFLSLLPHLTDLEIWSCSFHDDFYKEIADQASSSQIQTLKAYDLNLCHDQSASHCLGKFLSLLPHLTDLDIRPRCLHDDFYKEIADRASSSQIQTFKVFDLNLCDDQSASYFLGKFLSLLPHLTDLEIRPRCFHDAFYKEIADRASSSQIQTFKVYDLNLRNDQSASYCLGKFLSLLLHLTDLEIWSCYFHDDFYKEIADRASSSQIRTFKVYNLYLLYDQSASHCLGKFLSLLPHLTDLEIRPRCLHDAFYKEIADRASSSQTRLLVEDLMKDIPKEESEKPETVNCFGFTNELSVNLLDTKVLTINVKAPDTMKYKDLTAFPKEQELQHHPEPAEEPQYHPPVTSWAWNEGQGRTIIDLQQSNLPLAELLSFVAQSCPELRTLRLDANVPVFISEESVLESDSATSANESDEVDSPEIEIYMRCHQTTDLPVTALLAIVSSIFPKISDLTLDGDDQTKLDISGYMQPLPSRFLPQLRKLCLEQFMGSLCLLTFFKFVVEQLSHLPFLRISQCNVKVQMESKMEFSESALSHLEIIPVNVIPFACLNELVFKAFKSITNFIVQNIAAEHQIYLLLNWTKTRQMPTEKLYLKQSTPLKAFKDLLTIVKKFPRISKLETDECGSLERTEILEIVRTCTQLQYFSSVASGESRIFAVSDQFMQKPISKPISKSFDKRGGELRLETHDITLCVPEGAIQGEGEIEIGLQALTSPPSTHFQEDEMVCSFGFQCTIPNSPGFRFAVPVRVTLPHSAILDYPSKVRTGIYNGELWHDTGDVQISTITYIPSSENRLPRCEVDEKEITVFIDHFSFGWPVLKLRNPFVRGKRLGCLSFVPKGMPPTKKPILRVHLFDNVKGNPKEITEDESECDFRKVHPKKELKARANLDVTYGMDGSNNHDNEPEQSLRTILLSDIRQLIQNTVDFRLDFSQRVEQFASVNLSLTEGTRNRGNLSFDVDFTGGASGSSQDARADEGLASTSQLVTEDILTDKFVMTLSEKINPGQVTAEKFSVCLELGLAMGSSAAKQANVDKNQQNAFLYLLCKYVESNGRKSESAVNLRKKFLDNGMKEYADVIEAELEKFNIPFPSDEDSH